MVTAEEFMVASSNYNRLYREVEARLDGVTPVEWVVLHLAQEELSPGEMARRMRVDRSRLSRLVASLKAKGLITPTPRGNDARSFAVSLTDNGRGKL